MNEQDVTNPDGLLPSPPPGFRSGFVALIGRPNVGKSTLANRLVGEKVAIVSSVPQTTRNRIQGVRTLPGRAQIVFFDTPGIHKPHYRMNRRMVELALGTLSETDLILFMVDASAGKGAGDDFILARLEKVATPAFLLINKIDLVPRERLLPLIDAYRKRREFAEVVPISAAQGEQCDLLLDLIVQQLPEGPAFFPDDHLTDQPERVLAAEIIREKLFHRIREEIPHSIAVRIDEYVEEEELVRMAATILVERENHKGILIGRGGAMLKEVGTSARLELEQLLAARVFLTLWVSVERSWRQKASILDELGL